MSSHNYQLSWWLDYMPNSTQLYNCFEEKLVESSLGDASSELLQNLAMAGVSVVAFSLFEAVSRTALRMVGPNLPDIVSWWRSGSYRPRGLILAEKIYCLFSNLAALAVPAITIAHERLMTGPNPWSDKDVWNVVYGPCMPSDSPVLRCNFAIPSPPCFAPGQLCTPASCMIIWIIGEQVNARMRNIVSRALPAFTYAGVYLAYTVFYTCFYRDAIVENKEEISAETNEDKEDAADLETQPILVQKITIESLGLVEKPSSIHEADIKRVERWNICIASAVAFVALPILAGGSLFILLQKVNPQRNPFVEASFVMEECRNNCSYAFFLPWVSSWPSNLR